MTKWYEDERIDLSPIISSRIRLARNLKKYAFPICLTDGDAKKMISELAYAVSHSPNPLEESFDFHLLSELSCIEKRSMIEQHMISQTLFLSDKPTALIKQHDDSIGIMLNEEDHIRIQSIQPCAEIDKAWQAANAMDDAIETQLDYAFDKDFGYLTACPTNTGTGLRASFMVHLPMLERTGQLKNIIPALSKFGMTVRGIYGEGSEPLGSIYQISNQITLGKSEQEIIEALKNVTTQIVESENKLLAHALQKDPWSFEDNFYRSYGILSNCRMITVKESMTLLSNVRLGFITGVLKVKKPKHTIYRMMMDCQPGTLSVHQGKDLTEPEKNILRAETIRNKLFNNSI